MLLASTGVLLAQERTDPSASQGGTPPKTPTQKIPDNYIVVLKDKEKPKEVSQEHKNAHGVKVKNVYDKALKAYAAEISADKVNKVKADKRVLFVSEDREVQADAQTVPTGIERIGNDPSTQTNKANGVGVAVIDTGIDLDHPDLNVSQPSRDSSGNWTNGKNCMGTSLPDDDNGHGTHVAGTIAAKNDNVGVVGVAPEANLYAVKSLDSASKGSWSSIICGIDWATGTLTDSDAANDVKVVNMSLSGSGSDDGNCGNSNSDALHKALCNSVNAGVVHAVAAGNDNGADLATKVPAAYDEALTVTALADFNGSPGGGASATCRSDVDDTAADFSNMAVSTPDQGHTIAAPGVCIEATWLNGGYHTISGTSMAAPHIAGTAALYLANNSSAAPAQVIAKLREDAAAKSGTDANVDGYYGFTDDPNKPSGSRYYGYLEWSVGYNSSGDDTTSSPSDTTAPTVSSRSPSSGQTRVRRATNVTATFSEAMDKATLTNSTVTLVKSGSTTPVAATVTLSSDGKTVTLDPSASLAKKALYTAKIEGAKDLAGNPLATTTWSFKTGRK